MVMSLLKSLYKSLYKNAKDPTLSILGHHGGRRKVASLRPPFSTPLRSLGEPDPDTPFLVPIEHAPPLFVRIREDKISLKIYPAPLSIQKDNHQLISKRQKAGGGDCFGRLIARWSSFMHVSVYLEAESPCQFPVFQTTHFGALVRLLFHESRTSCFLDFNCDGYYDGALSARARGFTFCAHFYF